MAKNKDTKHCGTCMHREHKYANWWQENHIDGCSWICLITLKTVTRGNDCHCKMHSGLTKDGWKNRKQYNKPLTNNIWKPKKIILAKATNALK